MGLVTELRVLIHQTVRDALRQEQEQAKAAAPPPARVSDPLDVLTVAQVAQSLQVNDKTVREWIHRGRLKAFEAGGWRIRRAELEAFMQAGRAQSETIDIEAEAARIVQFARRRRARKA